MKAVNPGMTGMYCDEKEDKESTVCSYLLQSKNFTTVNKEDFELQEFVVEAQEISKF